MKVRLPISLLPALLLALVVSVTPPSLAAPPRPPMNAGEMEIALHRLSVTGTALYVAAHPDDENTAFLTWLENVRGVRAAYVSCTRGDGGQNLIGTEKGDLLGVVRTQELLAARRIDGAEQFFTRALDFGYSKNPEETLDFWGRDSILADLVRTIRLVRPDIIVDRFPTTGEGGHGHHTASAILAMEAFKAAGDPMRFPEQVARYGTWSARRIVWNWFTGSTPPDSAQRRELVTADIGDYVPALGKSSNELAAESRSMHKSQGFGSPERRGSQLNWFKVMDGDTTTTDLFAGIDLSWNRVAGAGEIGTAIARIEAAYDPVNPAASVPALVDLHRAMRTLRDKLTAPADRALLDRKLVDLSELIRSAAGLWLEAVSGLRTFAPGDSLKIATTAVERGAVPVTLASVTIGFADGSPGYSRSVSQSLADNAPATFVLAGLFPAGLDWRSTQPYWLIEKPGRGTHTLADPAVLDRPENPPLAVARFEFTIAGEPIGFDLPVVQRSVDRVKGERYQPIAAVPPVSVHLDENVYLFPDGKPRDVRVTAVGARAGRGTVRLRVPSGWSATPNEVAVDLPGNGGSVDGKFRLAPGSGVTPSASGTVPILAAEVTFDGARYDRDLLEIRYDHIPTQTLFPPAEAKLVRLDLAKRGSEVGYVMGPGDEVPDLLAQAGYHVTILTDADLDTTDLARFDAIVIGIRAYNSRDALKRENGRIQAFARGGGTVVIQYNTADNTLYAAFAPGGLKLGRDRVTVEEAPITLLDPRSPLLTTPNAIGPADFNGWVQERGLYFASEWDSTWTPLFACNDPGEPARKGALLVSHPGRGTCIYTGLAFWRQLAAGVPGAVRLFVNLVSAHPAGEPRP